MPIFAGGVHMVAPKSYEARMTVLVQEPGRLNPFLNDLAIGPNVKDRMPALTALVKSEHILRAVLEDMGQLPSNADARTKELKVGELASALSVQLIGSELVEVKMRSPKPTGLAKTLDAVSRRFIERVVSPERGAVESSESFLGEQLAAKRAELAAAEQAFADFKAEHADKLPALYSTECHASRRHAAEARRKADGAGDGGVELQRSAHARLLSEPGGGPDRGADRAGVERTGVACARATRPAFQKCSAPSASWIVSKRNGRRCWPRRARSSLPIWTACGILQPASTDGEKKSARLLSVQMQRIQEAEGKRNALR